MEPGEPGRESRVLGLWRWWGVERCKEIVEVRKQ